MVYFCSRCYGAKFVTVKLVQDGELYRCPQNSSHVFYIDAQGFPKLKKD
jgi:DNA-directed RNA polymerase subunit RPC12/RpoP